jgi:hypothetical protein
VVTVSVSRIVAPVSSKWSTVMLEPLMVIRVAP